MKYLFQINIVLVFVGFTTLAGCNAPAPHPTNIPANDNNAFRADLLLHARLQQILNTDSVYAAQAAGNSEPAQLDSTTAAIDQLEIALLQTIDSLGRTKSTTGNDSNLQMVLSNFRMMINSRKTLSDLRMVVSANTDDSASAQQTLSTMRSTIAQKDKQLVTLERAVNNRAIGNTPARSYAPARGDGPEAMRQRNSNLNLAYSSLQNKYFVLGRNYLVLKQNHERTLKELETARKNNNPR